ncbi:MAG: SIS domain-containing protein [Verrucomicrobia bacterium]|nr:SIS domain-containing protein [Verrucomicrobiota bacterium]
MTENNGIDRFYHAVLAQLEKVRQTQAASLQTTAEWLAQALVADRWLYVFGTGHSHMLAEEVFYRAGGLARAAPILDHRLMLHHEAIQATYVERETGLADRILASYPVAPGDILIVASNSGRNAVPIEMALRGKELGLRTIAVTNMEQSQAWPSRHTSGKRLFEVCDLVLDNCGVSGDACLDFPGLPGRVGPMSSLTGLFLINAMVVEAIRLALLKGTCPEIYISSNTNGDAHNHQLLEKYRGRLRHL